MAWSNIAASETDANSPLNQTLMDKFRGNMDYLYSIGSSISNFHDSDEDSGASATATFTIDDNIDWRDRNISLRGLIAWARNENDGGIPSLATVQKILPGGDEDDDVWFFMGNSGWTDGAPTFGAGNAIDFEFIDAWFYSGAGGAAYNTLPYIRALGQGSAKAIDAYLWIDSGDSGKLKITAVFSNAVNYAHYAAWNLQVTYSGDLGGV